MTSPQRLTVGSTVLGVNDLSRAQEFYCAALDYEVSGTPDDTWAILVPRNGSGAQLALGLSDTPVQRHPRIHLDLYAQDQAAEVDRLIALGASRVNWDRYPAEPDFVVLADPEGNIFCVIDKGDPAGG